MTYRQRVFVEEYLKCGNATESATKAGYSRKTAYSQGQRLLKNVEVSAEIERRLSDKTMAANEVLERLTQHARGTFEPFLTPEGRIDLMSDSAKASIGLLRKVKVKERTFVRGDTPILEIDTEIEIQDQQAAPVVPEPMNGSRTVPFGLTH